MKKNNMHFLNELKDGLQEIQKTIVTSSKKVSTN